jgi:hypothetical protein
MLRRIAVIALCLLPAAAQDAAKPIDPKKRAAIEEMITLINLQDQQRQVLDQVKQVIGKQIQESFTRDVSQSGGNPELIMPEFKAFLDRVYERMSLRLSWEKMRPEYVHLYDETFSLDELTAIVDFYKTPGGKALLVKMPAVLSRGIALGQKMMAGFDQEIAPLAAEFAETVKKKVPK